MEDSPELYDTPMGFSKSVEPTDLVGIYLINESIAELCGGTFHH